VKHELGYISNYSLNNYFSKLADLWNIEHAEQVGDGDRRRTALRTYHADDVEEVERRQRVGRGALVCDVGRGCPVDWKEL